MKQEQYELFPGWNYSADGLARPAKIQPRAKQGYCDSKWWARLDGPEHGKFEDVPFDDPYWKQFKDGSK